MATRKRRTSRRSTRRSVEFVVPPPDSREEAFSQVPIAVITFMAIAEALGIDQQVAPHFALSAAQRKLVRDAGPPLPLQEKLAHPRSQYTLADLAGMALAVGEHVASYPFPEQIEAALLFPKLLVPMSEAMEEALSLAGAEAPQHLATFPSLGAKPTHDADRPRPAARKGATATGRATGTEEEAVFQFKITLRGSDPPIWRRILVPDGTLDDLHHHIQGAMGWTNSHLHQFTIRDERYGDPGLLSGGWDTFEGEDSTATRLSDILPPTNRRFKFMYEYDFGDGWEHEIVFERRIAAETASAKAAALPQGASKDRKAKKKYPLCIDGAGACPPEDIGGIWGYYDFLEAISDREHPQHKDYRDWYGPFDPQKFDPARATRCMQRGR